ncbi:MAG: selenocysteine-specific translation elongation factor [Candidatus Aminicenantes bacterium RBG_16_63_16]|nr:MAG: selenocysteine-specific translation elongation factor [Candidatus Aminicenantes bacterium RBG_16_63_16]
MPETERDDLIVGTAGHVDHGKSALVKALTGIDPDTLPEEKERGLTIELGFIFMDAPGYDRQIVFIDVPGHEKFVKTMVAGASHIDLALLVIAADEGVSVQTREHFDVLQLLGIPRGIVALTKSDLVEAGRLAALEGEVKSFLLGTFMEGAPVIPVSALTGTGLDGLKSAIRREGGLVPKREDRGIFRMPIDRLFIMQGFGTVVAGTVLGGEVRAGDDVEIYPDGLKTRVRGIHVHNRDVERSGIGRRTALNIRDIGKHLLRRGQCIAAPGSLEATNRLDARLSLLKRHGKDLKNRERVRVHVGTDEAVVRLSLLDRGILSPGDSAPAQLLLESPAVALPGDRFVIRALSPAMTIGGGVVLDASPPKHKREDAAVIEEIKKLEGPLEDRLEGLLLRSGFRPLKAADLARRLGYKAEVIRGPLDGLAAGSKIKRIGADKDEAYLHAGAYDELAKRLISQVKKQTETRAYRPLTPVAELRARFQKLTDGAAFAAVLADLIDQRVLIQRDTGIGLPGIGPARGKKEQELMDRVEMAFKRAGFASPLEEDIQRKLGVNLGPFREIMRSLVEEKKLVRLDPKVTYHQATVQAAKEMVLTHLARHQSITIAELRTKLGLSRKYAHAILEFFDKTGLTRRVEDRHVRS